MHESQPGGQFGQIGPEAPPGGHFWQIVCERSRVADLFERPLAWPILEYWSRNAPRWPFWANFCERSRMAVLCECPLVANFGRLAWEYPLVPDLSRLVLDRLWWPIWGRLAQKCPLVADMGRMVHEGLLVADLGIFVCVSTPWWSISADWPGSTPWCLI